MLPNKIEIPFIVVHDKKLDNGWGNQPSLHLNGL